ncbi:MAG: transposase [Candidatus Saccharibacteria bacterium]|nr:transposase [Moraxellaceae bacterium]
MRTYIRDRTCGATYFITLNLLDRQSKLLTAHIEEFRIAYRRTQHSVPFELNALVVLPDHVHLMLTLSEGDDDCAKRISCLKGQFSCQIPKTEFINESRTSKGERGIWQRRYWEHRIRDELDYQRHMDYIHYNSVKHGHVLKVSDWVYSTFHRYVRQGVYPVNWTNDGLTDFEGVGESDV